MAHAEEAAPSEIARKQAAEIFVKLQGDLSSIQSGPVTKKVLKTLHASYMQLGMIMPRTLESLIPALTEKVR